MRSSIDETSKQKNKPPRSRFSQWRDERAVKRTVRRWHKSERKAARRGRFGDLLQRQFLKVIFQKNEPVFRFQFLKGGKDDAP